MWGLRTLLALVLMLGAAHHAEAVPRGVTMRLGEAMRVREISPRDPAVSILGVSLARNESESFVIALDVPEGLQGEYSLLLEGFTLDTGGSPDVVNALMAENVRVYVVREVEADEAVDPALWFNQTLPARAVLRRNAYRDRLDPVGGRTLGLPPGETLLWVTIHMGADAPAGETLGRVALRRDGAEAAGAPMRLRIWGFELPKSPSFGFVAGDPRGLDILNFNNDPSRFRPTALDYAAHRVSLSKVFPDPGVSFDEAGTPSIEFGLFDKGAEFLIDGLGMRYVLFPLSYVFGAHGAVNRGVYGPYVLGTDNEGFKRRMVLTARAVADHLERRGWLDNTWYYFFDEPRPGIYDVVRDLAGAVRNGDGRIRPMAVGPPPVEYLAGYVLDWLYVPWHKQYDREFRVRRQGLGDRVGTYNHTESFSLAVEPIFTRELLWWAHAEGLDWMHHYTAASINPKLVRARALDYWNLILYPDARPGGLYSASVRWEMLRDGLEDYDYLELVKGVGGPGAETLLEEARGLGGTLYERNLDPGRLSGLRGRAATLIEGGPGGGRR